MVGAGGFGREVVTLLRRLALDDRVWACGEVVDDAPSPANVHRLRRLGPMILGRVSDLLDRDGPLSVVVAVGDPDGRRQLVDRLSQNARTDVSFPILVHPDTTIGADVRLGEGTVVAPGVRLSASIDVSRHVHVDQNATVGHDVVLDDFVRLNPAACLSGDVRVGAGALIGANATVLQGLTIGSGAVVGAGAVVTRNVEPGRTVAGVPARVTG
ncbi:NeuD/PglB/VioB family sugar acetyltransferase [Ornithinimicrobium avium]|uniref:NeuD/PglB/VioB family sugar acetyltransferase n=1 Tax=Ornithinimicrobium avium TaxID=2283195 RepID=UPI001D18160D|nr:NeuD/PglB/VioB family sugar acetyltransferase [Ornithinimicrobium avium]